MFNNQFKISHEIKNQTVASVYDEEFDLVAGTYSKGLISIVDINFSNSIVFDNWDDLSSLYYDVIAYTAFGDLFLINKETGLVFLFEVQHNQLSNIEIETNTFFNDFLVDENIQTNVLKSRYFSNIMKNIELLQLEYTQCLVLKPWLILGGKDKPTNYITSNIAIYFDLVGQTIKKNKD